MDIISIDYKNDTLIYTKDGKNHTTKIYYTAGEDGHAYILINGRRRRFCDFTMKIYEY